MVIVTFLSASHFCSAHTVSLLFRHYSMVIIDLFDEQIAFCYALSLLSQPGTIPGLWEWVVRAYPFD